MKTRLIDTPLGKMMLCEESGMICRAAFAASPILPATSAASELLLEVERQMKDYFSGALTSFSLPVMISGTEFEQTVLQALLKIPYGQTRTYAQIAEIVGKPKAARAVGRACAKNPLLVLIPCHRVIGGNGKLTGYAAGEERKRALLTLEQNNLL